MHEPGFDLKDHVAVVTGASAGIGRAVALRLAEEGCNLALMARREVFLEETASLCSERGVDVSIHPVDLKKEADLEEALEDALAHHGSLELLVNNAGIMGHGAAHELNFADTRSVLEINTIALMNLTRLALPHMLVSQKRRSVINLASVAGKMSFKKGSAYVASKHAVVGFSGCLFEDVREAGIKVCVICPGYVNTPMMEDRRLDKEKMIQAQDIAEAVVFVARFPETGCPTEIIIRPQRSPY